MSTRIQNSTLGRLVDSPLGSDGCSHLWGNNRSVHHARHHDIDQDVLLLLQQRGHPAHELVDSRLGAAVYRIGIMGEDAPDASCDDNATARLGIVPHEVSRQLSAVYYSLIVDVNDVQLGSRRHLVNTLVLPVIDVNGGGINDASIGT